MAGEVFWRRYGEQCRRVRTEERHGGLVYPGVYRWVYTHGGGCTLATVATGLGAVHELGILLAHARTGPYAHLLDRAQTRRAQTRRAQAKRGPG